MKYIFIVFISIVFLGCSSNEVQPNIGDIKDSNASAKKETIHIYDLENLPQNVNAYLQNVEIENISAKQSIYEKHYFRVWNKQPQEKKRSAMWPFYSYKQGKSYGENLQLIEEKFFIKMKNNANFENYLSINKNAVTLKHLNIRAFPTLKPLLHDPSLAGEGFPFDYMQNSTVSANKPVFISHYSKDGEWVYIFTSFTGGWVKKNQVAIIDKKYTDIWQKAEQIFLLKDGIPIYNDKGEFLFDSKLGMVLALISEDKDSYTVLTISSYDGTKALYLKSKISKDIAHKGIVVFNKENLRSIISEVAKSKYGWGGIYNQRDCSSTLRDLYAPFGIWLPRNSSQQAKSGSIIKIATLSDAKKVELIKEKGIPFKTLLYKKGHILLYVGVYNGEIIAFHNMWGIRTKKDGVEGRIVIGKSVFSSLSLGSTQEYYDVNSEILRNLKSINILVN